VTDLNEFDIVHPDGQLVFLLGATGQLVFLLGAIEELGGKMFLLFLIVL
jgi:hypothetical protein